MYHSKEDILLIPHDSSKKAMSTWNLCTYMIWAAAQRTIFIL